jgi:hypothetical protein
LVVNDPALIHLIDFLALLIHNVHHTLKEQVGWQGSPPCYWSNDHIPPETILFVNDNNILDFLIRFVILLAKHAQNILPHANEPSFLCNMQESQRIIIREEIQ